MTAAPAIAASAATVTGTAWTCPDPAMTDPAPDHPIRPLRADDVDRVRRFYRGLSTGSVYRRFFTGGQPGDAELHRLFDADPGARDALVALSGDDVIGLVEGAVSWDLSGAVEIGVVVADAWQGRGIGWRLVCAVVRHAAARGATTIQAHTLADNRRMALLMRRLWPDARPHLDGSLSTWLVPIGPALLLTAAA